MELHLPNLLSGYLTAVDTVRREGQEVTVRGLKTREITNATLIFPAPSLPMLPVGVGRAVNPKLAAVEALQLIGGVSRPWHVIRAAPQFGEVLVDGSTESIEYGAYGPRAHAQLTGAVELLRTDPETRQAVVTIWRPDDLVHVGDKPCTVFLQFLVRYDLLELHVHMRSNDVWRGLAYDAFMFTQLQLTVARCLNRSPGQYVHHATSLHLYEGDEVAAARLDASMVPAPHLPVGLHATDLHEDSSRWSTYINLARQLLDGERSDGNTWYSKQVAKLGAAP